MLKSLKDVKDIGGKKVGHCCEDMGIPIPNYLTDMEKPIWVDEEANIIAFRFGETGCSFDSLIDVWSLLNSKGPSCSFCGSYQYETRHLIQGPNVLACDQCIELMVKMIRENDPLFCVHYVTEKNPNPILG